MKNLKRILEIVAYQRDEQGDFTLIFRQPNGYYNTIEGQSGYGMKVMLEGVLKLEHWVQVRTWIAMMDKEHEDKYVPGTNILKGSNEAMELEHENEMYESQEQYEYEMRMDAHFTDQKLNAAEDKAILGDLSALDALKKKMTGTLPDTLLPDLCPECGGLLRHKMSGRICDRYPCNFSVSL